MALFGRGGGDKARRPVEEAHPLVGRVIYCRICDKDLMFTRCWRRMVQMQKCPCCGLVFDNPAELYKRFQALCPQCAEPLEQPSFDYGFCDGCGSKYEIMEGSKPGLLPNRKQRAEMDKHGKAWSPYW
jgi:hypothetical protein